MYTVIGGDGKEYGPVTVAQVRTWIAAGRANLETKAKFLGTDEWKTLNDFPDFNGSPAAAEPPVVAPLTGADAKAIADELIARAGPLQILDCYERSWSLLKANFWPLLGATLLVFLAQFAAGCVPYLGILAGLLLGGVFMGGVYHFFLNKMRGIPTDIGDAFAGFRLAFIPLMFAGLVVTLLTMAGLVLLVLPGIYLGVAYAFTYALIIDRKLEFWTAMEVSRRVITAQWWRLFGLVLLGIPLALLGVICLIVGVFVAAVLVYGAMLYAYEDLCNPRSSK